MHVVATAGHVDHGKSTLLRALTGMEPDRWAQERARGMTIDLGFVWTALPSGAVVGFVDVPGHARFTGNMLAGLGPAPAVLFVVAADQGWGRQSTEHLAALDALGIRHGLLVVTRSDLADPAPVLAESSARLARSSLGSAPAVVASGSTGAGLDELRRALDELVAAAQPPVTAGRVRLWVDRSFTVRGSGTVVTGTLGAGTLRLGDELEVGPRTARVRGLQSLGTPYDEVAAVARVAVNLRGVHRDEVARGDALLTPGAWWSSDVLDVRLDTAVAATSLVLHVGTAAVPVRVRPLVPGAARLRLSRPLPLQVGDRGLLRDPGGQAVVSGLRVLDVAPPPLTRRGSAAARGHALVSGTLDVGVARADELAARGVSLDGARVREVAGWVVPTTQWDSWCGRLVALVDAHAAAAPQEAGIPAEDACRRLDLPARALLLPLAAEAGLEHCAGRLRRPGEEPRLAAGVAALEARLADAPFAAPDQPELDALGLSRREVAAAVSAGRLVALGAGVLLRPDAPALALQRLAALPQPFTASAARQALSTSRRVALPLLEHLDRHGWTRRVDRSLREVCRADP